MARKEKLPEHWQKLGVADMLAARAPVPAAHVEPAAVTLCECDRLRARVHELECELERTRARPPSETDGMVLRVWRHEK